MALNRLRAIRHGRLAATGLLLATVAGLVGACSEAKNPPRSQAPAQVGVYTVRAEPYTVRETLPGRARAYMSSEVRPQVEGIIEKRLFTEGADVKAGDVLYRIDPARYQAAREQSQAQLQQAQAALQADAPLAKRYQHLAAIDAISKQDRDNAVAALAQDKADIATAQANLKTAEINLGYTQIKAPIAGRIGASSVTPGALVTTNQTEPLATINRLDPIYVDIQQSSSQYLALKHAVATGRLETDSHNAAPVTVSPEGSDLTLTGRLQFSGASVDPDTGSVMLRAIVDNPDHDLLPGMYVRATLTQGIDVKALLVPQQGVSRNATGAPSALVVDETGHVARRPLQIAGATDDNRWRVTGGLSPGVRVIVQGTAKVSVGDAVHATPLVLNAQGALVPVPDKKTPSDDAPAPAAG